MVSFVLAAPARGPRPCWLRLLCAGLVLCLLAACPRGSRRTLVPELPSSGDPVAKDRFVSARASFLRDGGNAEELEAIAEEFPADPIAPFAQLYAGMAHVGERDYRAAESVLREVLDGDADERLKARATLYLGLALAYRGDKKQALPLLQKSERAVDGEAERGEYLAALAESTAALEPLAALPIYDQWFRIATAVERVYVLERVQALVAAADEAALVVAWQAVEDDGGPSRAVLGPAVAALREAAGRGEEARELREATAKLRHKLGLPALATVAVAGPPGTIGAILPLAGKQSRVAESAALGLALAAGAGDGRGAAIVEVRSADSAAEAEAAFEELVGLGAAAVVGPIGGAAVDAVAPRAERAQVPLLSLASRPEERAGGRFVFHLMHSAEARARALARRAAAAGVRKVAVLAPDSGYGRAVAAAFSSELARRGGTVVTSQSYPPDTRSFAGVVKKLDGSFAGVFVPEQADVLELIAPALAAAGLVPRPAGEKKAVGGRPIVLLSTAEGLAEDFAADAGRNAVGAMLAPGFFADPKDAVAKGFIERFTSAHGRPPGAVDAYAYDGAQLVAAAGALRGPALASALGELQLAGVTGAVAFDDANRRADDGVLYTVVASDAGAGFSIVVLAD